MKQSVFILSILFFVNTLLAQEVQWASEVLSYSSQYGAEHYSANQIVGVPNAMSEGEVAHWAWAPKKDEVNTIEFIRVKFLEPMSIQQVIVAESRNPGAVSKIVLYDTDNKKHTVYENTNPEKYDGDRRLFNVTFDKTDYRVKAIRLELKTGKVIGSNQIDAIGISSSPKKISIEVDEIEYAESVAPKESLGKLVNSRYAERLPIISADGKTLYLARKFHPLNEGDDKNDDIWVSKLQDNGSWGPAKPIRSPLNTPDHDFVVSVNPTGDVLYLGSDYRKSVKQGVSKSKNKNGSWGDPKALKIEDHKNDSPFVSYHVNNDEDILMMAVEREEGMGKRDLYVSFKEKGNSWSLPKNLGKTINTVNEESSVFLAADGKTIYFSSAGHLGYGGLDMFMSRRLDNSWTKWSKPKNLGKKINTLGNDYNYTIPASGDYAYFASDDESGMSDIYRILLPKEVQPEPVVLLSGRIIDAETNRPINAKLNFQSIKNKKKQKSYEPSADGNFQVVVPYGDDLALTAEFEGYFAPSENLELSGKQLKELDSDKGTTNAGDNPEMIAMQEKLDQLNGELKDLRVNKNKKQKPTKTKPSKKRNAELEALKAKYRQVSDEETEPVKEPADQSLDVKTKDKELEELERKYRDRYNKDKKKEETKPTKPKKDKVKVTDPSEVNIEDLEKKVRKELGKEIAAGIKDEIKDDVIDEVKETLVTSLSEDIGEILDENMIDKIVENLRKDVAKDIRKELRDAKPKANSGDVVSKVEKELRDALNDEVTEQIEADVRSSFENEIKNDMEYRLKRKAEEVLKVELETKQQEPAENMDIPEPEEVVEEEPLVVEYKEIEKDILLVPIKVGQVIPMNNIFFDANKASLKSVSDAELDRVTDFLKTNKNIVVEVGGHTNGWCSSDFANKLSTDRAVVVCQYFIDQGVSVDRVLYRGYGKTEPLADNDTLAGRKKNQRVELVIMEVK